MTIEGIRPSRLFYVSSYGGGLNMLVFMVAAFVALIIAVIIGFVWGILTLIGLVLIVFGGAIIILKREGKPDLLFVFAVVLGVIFIFMSLMGVELGTVDLRVIPGLEYIHNLFN